MTDSEKGLDHFIHELDNQDIRIKRNAAYKLGTFENEEAVEPLIKYLFDKDSVLRKAIIRSLQKISSNKAIEPLLQLYKKESSYKIKALIAQALGHFIYDDFDLGVLLDDLNEDYDYLRLKIIYALGNKKFKKSVPKLIELLTKDKNPEIRKMAAWALGFIEKREALEPLINALGDRSHKVRRRVAITLIELPYTKLKLKEILELMDKKEHPGKTNIIHIFGRLRYHNCVPRLMDLVVNSDDFRIRKKAAWALGLLKDARALQTLVKATNDPSKSVRVQAVKAFSNHPNINTEIINSLFDLLADDFYQVRINVINVFLCIIGTLSVPKEIYDRLDELTDLLINDPYENVRIKAANFFYHLEDKNTVEMLQKAFQDPSFEVRSYAANALLEIGEEVAMEQFIGALNDSNPKIRNPAFRVLYNYPKIKAYKEIIVQSLANESHLGRKSIVHIISKFNPPEALPYLLEIARKNEDLSLRESALWAISSYKGKKIEEALLYALSDDSPRIRFVADWILKRQFPKVSYNPPELPENWDQWGSKKKKRRKIVLTKEIKEDIPKLINLLRKSKNSLEKIQAIVAITKHANDERIIQPLIDALKDSAKKVRTSAAYTLEKVRKKEIIKHLISALNDPSPKVRKTAYISLSKSVDFFDEGEFLVKQLKNENHLGRKYCVHLLNRFAIENTESILIDLLKNEDDKALVKTTIYVACKYKNEELLKLLLNYLNSPISGIRSSVLSCFLYTNKGIRDKTDVLIKAFVDENHYGRDEIICILGSFGGKEETKTVIKALYDSQFYTRRTAHAILRMKMRSHLIPKDYDLLTRR